MLHAGRQSQRTATSARREFKSNDHSAALEFPTATHGSEWPPATAMILIASGTFCTIHGGTIRPCVTFIILPSTAPSGVVTNSHALSCPAMETSATLICMAPAEIRNDEAKAGLFVARGFHDVVNLWQQVRYGRLQPRCSRPRRDGTRPAVCRYGPHSRHPGRQAARPGLRAGDPLAPGLRRGAARIERFARFPRQQLLADRPSQRRRLDPSSMSEHCVALRALGAQAERRCEAPGAIAHP
jgi:hypothetical protein